LRNVPLLGANLNVTIYNSGALLGRIFHSVAAIILLTGVPAEAGLKRKHLWVLLGYGGAVLLTGLVTIASVMGVIPPFFIPISTQSCWKEASTSRGDPSCTLPQSQKLSQYFRRSMVSFFLQRKLLNERLAKNLLDRTHSGFSVDYANWNRSAPRRTVEA
jgi:hypothetical protein